MHITKFFYNIQTKDCEFFVYSGCGGNANNFMSALECESKCKKGTALLIEIPAAAINKIQTTDVNKTLNGSTALYPDDTKKVYFKPSAHKRTLDSSGSEITIKFGIIESYNDDLKNNTNPRNARMKFMVNEAVSIL